ncbi:cell cycle protein GpsB [Halobacillus andaensis]|uniref:Cell cycle protein GpsB n=1 Tax=Halobacillus andaensis TaxID=1176239 RepID=A0A917ET46_HALAA|nr:cell division regulator GpsB [Halobacillus andaensis]MBP2003311.1 DivIVA domain-containing protein [Halobacillus andaensis]GGF09708.1 cell cycle protein GpsB [Halobacillus andaensis]
MSEEKYNLDGKTILEKDFKTSMRGYNQEEVDEFLDLIIQDYEKFQKEIDQLQNENNRLKKYPARDDASTQRTKPVNNTQNHQVNYDILKRVSNLEKAVFGKKYAEE